MSMFLPSNKLLYIYYNEDFIDIDNKQQSAISFMLVRTTCQIRTIRRARIYEGIPNAAAMSMKGTHSMNKDFFPFSNKFVSQTDDLSSKRSSWRRHRLCCETEFYSKSLETDSAICGLYWKLSMKCLSVRVVNIGRDEVKTIRDSNQSRLLVMPSVMYHSNAIDYRRIEKVLFVIHHKYKCTITLTLTL